MSLPVLRAFVIAPLAFFLLFSTDLLAADNENSPPSITRSISTEQTVALPLHGHTKIKNHTIIADMSSCNLYRDKPEYVSHGRDDMRMKILSVLFLLRHKEQ